MLGKNTILKAIHNYNRLNIYFGRVWMLGKNTILKAIHNFILLFSLFISGVNAG